jgi:outer membrane biosynthesis protein TonB
MSIVRSIRFSSENERKAFVATCIIFLLLLLMLFFLKLSTKIKEQYEGGILVDFGTTETGLGNDNTSLGESSSGQTDIPQPEVTPQAAPPVKAQPTPSVQPVMTADNQEIALEAKKKREEERLRKEEEQKQKMLAEAEARARAEAEAKRKQEEEFRQKMQQGMQGVRGAGAGGQGSGSGEGQSTPGGNQGSPQGTPGAPKGQGTGQGTEGIGFSLGSRTMVSRPQVINEQQKSGTVVVTIKVDRSGNVIDANFRQQGSTTNDAYLVQLSINSAKKARFSPDSNAADEQFGTMTFNYVLR